MFVFVISNFMKSSTVYAASLCTFVRFESMTLPSIRFDISLNRKVKSLQIYFLTANRKKTFRRISSYKFGCRKKTLSDFLASRSSPSKRVNTAPGGWGQNMDQGSMDPHFGPGPWTVFFNNEKWTKTEIVKNKVKKQQQQQTMLDWSVMFNCAYIV